MDLTTTAQKAVEICGGQEFWLNASRIEAEVSVHGLAFVLKHRPAFQHAKIEMEVQRPVVRLTPIGRDPTITGILDHGDVRLESHDGKTLAERKDARSYFRFGRRLFYWDDLDMAYFANYAFWNYFTLPRLLLDKRISWEETGPGNLQATFPTSIPTHCRTQQYRFDPTRGLLLQHNYTVDIISQLATAAHVIRDHKKQEGILYPSSRVVTPQKGGGGYRKGPVLIDITVHSFSVK
jgi:hypothetical protein